MGIGRAAGVPRCRAVGIVGRASESAERRRIAMRRAALFVFLCLVATSAFAQLPPGKWWRRPEIVQTLGLTEEQQDRLDTIFRAAANDLIDAKAEMDKG